MEKFGIFLVSIWFGFLFGTLYWTQELNDDVTLATKCKEGGVIEMQDKSFICELKEVEVKTTYTIKGE